MLIPRQNLYMQKVLRYILGYMIFYIFSNHSIFRLDTHVP